MLTNTGQLIPFVVGLLGLFRILHLMVIRFSENSQKDRSIKVVGQGKFIYDIGKEKELTLEANRPQRRWSIDSSQVGLLVGTESLPDGPRQSLRSLSWKSEA